ncbi:MAG: Glutamine--fructose-6-phosphate aminotransferase (isomerizing) [candidate division BRC1 bacterium ADurb.BinA364]|nr:MAG: Glutamine--fructose-6-phosphate aminotransferase (isomerizing) [candidate division BRC1 bacterium ADurb.BinA364]
MCGIVGILSRAPVAVKLLEGLKRLEYRGYDSAGIATIGDGAMHCEKVVGRVEQLQPSVDSGRLSGTIGIAHTRWATHGAPSVVNAHPHMDENEEIAIVHNGVIENYLALKEYLIGRGRKFKSETDTEVIVHLIAEFMDKGLMSAVRETASRLEGTFGLIVISRKDPYRMIAVRQGSPIVFGIGEHEYFVASDVSAMVDSTRQVIFLDDGEIVDITLSGYRTMNFEDVTVVKDSTQIDWEIEAIEKGGFEHFMLKEIFEQPEALENTFRGRLRPAEERIVLGGISGMSESELRALRRVIISACGTAYHAGLVAEYQIEELARLPVEVEYASEFRYRDPLVGTDDLTIVISQSGETIDTLSAMREAKTKGSRVMGICNVVGSTIAREAGMGVYTHAGPEIGVASTKAFMAQIAVLAMFSLYLGRLRALSPEANKTLLDELAEMPNLVRRTLENAESVKEVAEEFAEARNYLFLGRGINYPVALEGALKLKEISYIHAEGYPAAEMKHGPIALIDENMPVVVIATRDATYEKILANIAEIKARKGRIIAVATEGDNRMAEEVDRVIYVPQTRPLFAPFVATVPLQLLAYYTALLRGCDVDKPRNLAKSVTVE